MIKEICSWLQTFRPSNQGGSQGHIPLITNSFLRILLSYPNSSINGTDIYFTVYMNSCDHEKSCNNVTTSARSVHPCLHTSTKTQRPFINCAVNDALVHDMPNMKQTLLQFVDTVHPWLVDSLLDDAPYLVVHWIEVGTVWWPYVWI